MRLSSGHRAVVSSFLVHGGAFGLTYNFSALIGQIAADVSGGSLTVIAAVGGLTSSVFLLLSLPAGWLVDVIGSKQVMTLGALVAPASLAIAGHSTSVGILFLSMACGLGLGIALLFVPSLVLVGEHCGPRNAFWTGVAASGAGVGSLIVGPLLLLLVENHGWRPALQLMSLVTLCLFGSAVLLAPSGRTDPDLALIEAQAITEDVRFWILLSVTALVGLAYYVPFILLSEYLRSSGFASTAILISAILLGLSNAVSRVGMGLLAESTPASTLWMSAIALMAAGCLALGLSDPDILILTSFGIAAFGVGSGAFIALLPPLARRSTSKWPPGQTLGAVYAALALGAGVGPALAASFSSQGRQQGWLFVGCGVVLGIGMVSSRSSLFEK